MCSSIAGPCGFQLDGFLNFEELKGGLKVPAAVSKASGMEILPRASFLTCFSLIFHLFFTCFSLARLDRY